MIDLASRLARHPRVHLGHTPTPIDAAPALGERLGLDLHIKRDDCTGLGMGGNKVRQIEFYLGEARAAGADSVVITGAVQSNFVRTVAAGARQLGMEPHLQLEERVSGGDERYYGSGNVLLERLLGATLYSFPVGEDEAAADAGIEAIAESLRSQGRSPYVIHLGIDHPPIGGLGYAAGALEIVEQCRVSGGDFDAIVTASGSALTHGGLLAGLRLLGSTMPVYGVCVRREVALQRPRVAQRAAEIERLLGEPGREDDDDVHVTDAVFAPGYGKMSAQVWEAMSDAARLEGLFLDPVYTGKSMAGLFHLTREGVIPPGARVLYMNTGGQPAIFAYEGMLSEWLEPAPDAVAAMGG